MDKVRLQVFSSEHRLRRRSDAPRSEARGTNDSWLRWTSGDFFLNSIALNAGPRRNLASRALPHTSPMSQSGLQPEFYICLANRRLKRRQERIHRKRKIPKRDQGQDAEAIPK